MLKYSEDLWDTVVCATVLSGFGTSDLYIYIPQGLTIPQIVVTKMGILTETCYHPCGDGCYLFLLSNFTREIGLKLYVYLLFESPSHTKLITTNNNKKRYKAQYDKISIDSQSKPFWNVI